MSWFTLGLLVSLPALAQSTSGISQRSRGVEFEVSLKASAEVLEHSKSGGTGPLDAHLIHRFEPQELNPHRRRFALERNLSLVGLHTRVLAASSSPKSKPSYRVIVEGMESQTRVHLREKGPWYENLDQIACVFRSKTESGGAGFDFLKAWEFRHSPKTRSLQSAFQIEPLHSTEQASRIAAEEAREGWEKLLAAKLPVLGRKLGLVREASEARALLRAELLIAEWRDELEQLYSQEVLSVARQKQFQFEKSRVEESGLCATQEEQTARVPSLPSPFLEARESGAEVKDVKTSATPKILARVPAKQTSGIFTVRTGLRFQGRTLVGRFLIDSSTPVSLVDPKWLGAQGVNAKLLRTQSGVPVRVNWAFGSGMAEPLAANFGVEWGGASLPGELNFHSLKLRGTLGLPEYASECCDGVLGLDFLRSHLLEFVSGPKPAVQVWDILGTERGQGLDPVETWVTQNGQILSDGLWMDEKTKKPLARGTLWSLGQKAGLMGLPIKSQGLALSLDWSGERGGLTLEMNDQGVQTPTIGMGSLGRDRFVMDLKRGRIWVRTRALLAPEASDRAGIELGYFEVDEVTRPLFAAVRAVRVLGLKAGGAAQKQLAPQGLTPGVELLEIQGRSVEGLDRWEIEQAFAGKWGPALELKWRGAGKGKSNEKGISTATLQLGPDAPVENLKH